MDDKELARARLAAFNLLARREHSRKELLDKLGRRFEDREILEELLDQLQEEGLQSDERFVESFIHERIQRSHGPVKIRYELKQKGVSDEHIEIAMEPYKETWMDLARELVRRKYGLEVPNDLKEKQRRMRFVMQRGFPADICYGLFD